MNVRCMNNNRKQIAHYIDYNMPLASFCLFHRQYLVLLLRLSFSRPVNQ